SARELGWSQVDAGFRWSVGRSETRCVGSIVHRLHQTRGPGPTSNTVESAYAVYYGERRVPGTTFSQGLGS
ncbi:unnamed protein product, partial [Oikopleura dioica]